MSISGFRFDGNRTNQTSGRGIDVAAGLSRVTVKGNRLDNVWGEAIFATDTSDIEISENLISNSGQAAASANNTSLIRYVGTTAVTSKNIRISKNRLDASSSNVGGIKLAAAAATAILNNAFVQDNSIIVGDNGAEDTLGIELFTSTGGLIRGGTVTGNIVTGENATNTNIFGISLGGVATVADTTGVRSISVSANTIRDCRVMGIEVIGTDVSVTGNVLTGSGPIAVLASLVTGGIKGVSITGNTLRSNAEPNYAIRLDGTIEGLSIVGNVAYDPAGPFINQSGSGYTVTNSTISNNTVVSGGQGLVLSTGSSLTNSKIENNWFDLTGAGANADGIYLGGTTQNNLVIRGNRIIAATRYGINFPATASDMVVDGNIVSGSTSTGIIWQAAGANWKISNNYVYSNGAWGMDLSGNPTVVQFYGNKARNNTSGNFAFGSTTFDAVGEDRIPRIKSSGTALVAGDFALGAGWGAGAAVSAVTGTDIGWQITITAAGVPAANAVATLTYKDGTWTNAPLCLTNQNGGTGAILPVTCVPTATTNVMTYNGIPVAGLTYILTGVTIGR